MQVIPMLQSFPVCQICRNRTEMFHSGKRSKLNRSVLLFTNKILKWDTLKQEKKIFSFLFSFFKLKCIQHGWNLADKAILLWVLKEDFISRWLKLQHTWPSRVDILKGQSRCSSILQNGLSNLNIYKLTTGCSKKTAPAM